MQDLIEFVGSLGRPQVALLGDFMLDRYLYGYCERVSQEAPVPVLRVVSRASGPGGAASVAAGVLAMGGGVQCLGVIGSDAAGEELLGHLGRLGAETDSLIRLTDRPTATKDRLVGLAQHRHQQQMMRVDEEDTSPLADDVHDRLRAAAQVAVADGGVLAIQDHDKGVISESATPQLIADARSSGATVVVDPAKIDDYRRYRGATLLTPNRQECELASEVSIVDDASAAAAAERILHITEADAVVITLDKEGAYLKVAGEAGKRFGAQARQVYDITGAGDTVLAALSVALAGGADRAAAVAMAMVAGGLAVERFGVVAVSRQQVLDTLALEKRQQHGKVISREELMAEVERLRGSNRAIVWTNGCFDILHAGHVEYLNFARRQGDALIVGVNSDASVRQNKGPGRPIVAAEDRAEVLAALECVDYVVLFDEPTPLALIEAIRPDVLVKGADWKGAVVGQEAVEAAGGRVALAELRPGRSTTKVINRIAELYGNGSDDTPADS